MSTRQTELLTRARGLLEQVAESEQQEAVRALSNGAFDNAKAMIGRVERVQEMVRVLDEMIGPRPQPSEIDTVDSKRRDLGRLAAGVKTPQADFREPILRALSAMGGRGKVQDVLDRVEILVGASLKAVDKQPLPSDPKQPRWRNTAQWARLELANEGLLRDDSPRGVWELSQAGSSHLRRGGHS